MFRTLSREERECLKFLEETIDSLDHDSEDPEAKRLSGGSNLAVGNSNTPHLVLPGHSLNPKEQDIIDLVQSQPKEVLYSPTMPDFQSMVMNPETHFDLKPRRQPLENFPYDFKPQPTATLSSTSENQNSDHSTSYSLHHPAGSIPTPVVIAQKLAEHQKARSKNMPSKILSSQRRTLESDRGPSSLDHPVKQGPPTAAKPTHLPANINLIVSNKDYHQPGTKPPINLQERKTQVLTHLSGPPEPEETVRIQPTQSASYRDPTPDRSRMEALSKLGLTADQPSHSSINTSGPSINKVEASSQSAYYTDKMEPVPQSAMSAIKKDNYNADFNNYGGKTRAMAASTRSSSTREPHIDNFDKKTDIVPIIPGRNEVSFSDFNSSGGKTKIMNQVSGIKIDTAARHPHNYEDRTSPVFIAGGSPVPKAEVSVNSYGGKSKIMTPASLLTAPQVSYYESRPNAVPHHAGSTVTNTEVSTNSYGGKSKVMIPTASMNIDTTDNYPNFYESRPNAVDNTQTAKVGVTSNSYGGKSKVISPTPVSTGKLETSPNSMVSHNSKHVTRPEAILNDFNSYGVKGKAVSPAAMSSHKPEAFARNPKQHSPVVIPKLPQASPDSVLANRSELIFPYSHGLSHQRTQGSTALSLQSQGERQPSFSKAKASLPPQGITVQFSGRGPMDESRRDALRKLGLLKEKSSFSLAHY